MTILFLGSGIILLASCRVVGLRVGVSTSNRKYNYETASIHHFVGCPPPHRRWHEYLKMLHYHKIHTRMDIYTTRGACCGVPNCATTTTRTVLVIDQSRHPPLPHNFKMASAGFVRFVSPAILLWSDPPTHASWTKSWGVSLRAILCRIGWAS